MSEDLLVDLLAIYQKFKPNRLMISLICSAGTDAALATKISSVLSILRRNRTDEIARLISNWRRVLLNVWRISEGTVCKLILFMASSISF